MLTSIFATKIGMTQAWDTKGKRWPVTKCAVKPNMVLGRQADQVLIGYGSKKLKNMSKPLQTIVTRGGFSLGAKQIKGVRMAASAESEEATTPEAGQTIPAQDVLKVGDVVKVQGTSKGRGFAGAMKRHNFHGGPATHGQSDRARAVGSVGAGTTPGKVLKGKKMPGHYGVETKTVSNLVVLHIDKSNQEVWLSGPVPGHLKSIVAITPTGKSKSIELDIKASGLPEPKAEVEAEEKTEENQTEEKPESAAVEPAEQAPADEAKKSEDKPDSDIKKAEK